MLRRMPKHMVPLQEPAHPKQSLLLCIVPSDVYSSWLEMIGIILISSHRAHRRMSAWRHSGLLTSDKHTHTHCVLSPHIVLTVNRKFKRTILSLPTILLINYELDSPHVCFNHFHTHISTMHHSYLYTVALSYLGVECQLWHLGTKWKRLMFIACT